MAKTISIGQLRQNPTAMIREVRAGATYTLTDHGEPIAEIVPYRPRGGVPTEKVAELLEYLGPDPAWAAEIEKNRREFFVMEDPWERHK
jgi:prevent-host-death family protein